MSEHFVVEADRRVVGVAVRVPGGFKFFASDTDFQQIEGQTFPRVSAINRRVQQINEARRIAPVFARRSAGRKSGNP